MEKLFLIFLLVLSSNFYLAQNLVPNSGFETYISCPNNSSQITLAVPWTGPNNSTDYYNTCATNSFFTIPYRGLNDYQLTKSGNAYAGFLAYNSPGSNDREYLRIQLSNSLMPTSCYYIEFYINLINNTRYAVNNVGISITNFPVSAYSIGTVLNQTPQIKKFGNPVIRDTLNWVKIAGVYQAGGGENYITIGNFNSDATTDTIYTGHTAGPFPAYPAAYYYVEDVSLTPITPSLMPAIAGNDATINLGDSVFIGQQISNLNCNWYNGTVQIASNTSGLYVKPVSTTTYVVQQNLCGNFTTDTVVVNVNSGAGISELEVTSSDFIVSPNPGDGYFTIEILNKEFIFQDSRIKIIDVLGKEVANFKLESLKHVFDIRKFEAGVYFLQLQKDDKTILTKKIIKQ